MKLTVADFSAIGVCLEGFLYGLYSGIFVIFLRGASKNFLFYVLCALYALSGVIVVLDAIYVINSTHIPWNPTVFHYLGFMQNTVSGCCDFIAQFILIYRCWIVWGYNIRAVILPSILAFTYLVIWLAGSGSEHIFSSQFVQPPWGYWMILAAIVMSITVNALVTSLIVFKIFKVYHEIKLASGDQGSGATGGSKIRTVMFIIIESGMLLLSSQLARVVVTLLLPTDAATKAFYIVASIQEMLNGITPTIILVRVSMGLSFHDKESMIESTIGTLRFAANNPKSISETETEDVAIVNRDDDIGVPQSEDIEMDDHIEPRGSVH
ncbi:hypothetical protein BYT27DRAFT_7240456 [Phlegmacium glaucopus]|nr:hypothetical protein BYT27DRAFT_7240456 [Phlegmacium glaucopus]